MKIQISIDDKLAAKIDKIAEGMYMSRSGFIAFSCAQIIYQQELLSAVNQLSSIMRQVANNSEITDEDKKNLEDIESLLLILSQKR